MLGRLETCRSEVKVIGYTGRYRLILSFSKHENEKWDFVPAVIQFHIAHENIRKITDQANINFQQTVLETSQGANSHHLKNPRRII